ncbi:hypothetical protein [Kitasatospora sp. NPDC094011]|uniref:hypothetical protein n=1 Tax=Kitasatospora sp. NPDC094011 TaxID=3364090 RepID=UPI0038245158
MQMRHIGKRRHWLDPVDPQGVSAEIDSPLGTVRVDRKRTGAVTSFGSRLEQWDFVLDGTCILSVDGMFNAGYPARRRVRRGLDITLLGEPGRVSAARTLRPGRRYVRMSTPTLAYEARTHFPGYIVRDGNGIERARYDGAFWEFEEPDPAAVAFASFFIAAALEPFMTSPLLEIF